MNIVLSATLFGGFAVWAFFALVRLQAAWETSQQKTGELRGALTAAGRKLLSDLETIQKLEAEVVRIKETAATALRDQKERHETLARAAPPPLPEVHIASEYPPSRRDTAWIVDFVRDSALPHQPWEREPPTSLVWAPSQSAAFDRGYQLIRAHKTYTIAGVRPLA